MHVTATSSNATNVIPKLTIKPLQKLHDTTTSSSTSSSSAAAAAASTTADAPEEATTSKIPKLTIKTGQEHAVIITQHNDNAHVMGGGIPKLTIKTKSLDTQDDSSNANPTNAEISPNEKIPKITIKTNNLDSPNIKLHEPQQQSKINAVPISTVAVVSSGGQTPTVQGNVQSSFPTDTDEFADLINVDNGTGESSNSQEFCGFNDNTADSSARVVVIAVSDLTNIHDDTELHNIVELHNGKLLHPKVAQIIDTVDLTSSPSRSCSPAQFDYNEDSNSMTENANNNLASNLTIPSTNILLERLQREATVIHNTQQLKQQQSEQQEPQQHLANAMVPIPPPCRQNQMPHNKPHQPL
ncbi:Supporter of activation of yellow protein [Eumeta japonica]|uniref:Supporter of activation of yellow protein n=1 Tax=Eumeta variegata TaxID=151549 RepID=A0A4C1SLF4_EUMVA|nr:Supporter of activation of yellow protein [Eumeta japonica]